MVDPLTGLSLPKFEQDEQILKMAQSQMQEIDQRAKQIVKNEIYRDRLDTGDRGKNKLYKSTDGRAANEEYELDDELPNHARVTRPQLNNQDCVINGKARVLEDVQSEECD